MTISLIRHFWPGEKEPLPLSKYCDLSKWSKKTHPSLRYPAERAVRGTPQKAQPAVPYRPEEYRTRTRYCETTLTFYYRTHHYGSVYRHRPRYRILVTALGFVFLLHLDRSQYLERGRGTGNLTDFEDNISSYIDEDKFLIVQIVSNQQISMSQYRNHPI